MSGITDSAKFNKNSSYYVEIDPTAGGGQVIQGNLSVSGNISAGGNNTTVGLASSGSLTVSGVTSLGNNGTSLTSVGAGGLAVLGNTAVAGVTNSGSFVSIGPVKAQNATRRINLNVSDNITDPITVPWTGVTQQLMGVIQGAGNNFSVNYTMPADLLTNPDYIGMTIAEGCLVFTASRVVGLGVIDSSGAVIVSGFVSQANIGGPYCYFKITKTTPSGAFPNGIYLQLGKDVNTQVG
jgi:hypothetical protein